MTRFAVDADDFDVVAGVACLESGSVFERVGGDNAVVVVGSGNEDGRVGGAVVFNVVQGRVFEEVFSHFGAIVASAK